MPDSIDRATFLKRTGLATAALAAPPLLSPLGASAAPPPSGTTFSGAFIDGTGDTGWLQLLDTAARMYQPDPDFEDIAMLYTQEWNGFWEGPTWGRWWIQNSIGATYASLPFFQEPHATFILNANALWWDKIADGQRADFFGFVAPDGCLCDAADLTNVFYRQGDADVNEHDWVFGFTIAGILLQSELLLIQRDADKLAKYVPLIERSAEFIESRRDPSNNLFLAGSASNLLAPSYGGYAMPDGTVGHAYLAELSTNYIAALDRLIEVEKLAGRPRMAERYAARSAAVRRGLPALMTDEGYFVKSIDPDGTKHGVYGAAQHGYFESVVNQDAIAYRVVDDQQAMRIYEKMESIPQLRPNGVTITNYPALDDVASGDLNYPGYAPDWVYGTWVDGGYWSTCEARAVLGYLRLGKYADARRSMENLLGWARQFKMDAPMRDFGATPWQFTLPVNSVYDGWGVPGALLRGLFEYEYTAAGLRLRPHIPDGITALNQSMPVKFGQKRLYLATEGSGPVTAVWVNGKRKAPESPGSVFLQDGELASETQITIQLGHQPRPKPKTTIPSPPPLNIPPADDSFWDVADFGSPFPLRIGADQNGGSLYSGSMNRIQIYTAALTADQIAQLAADATAPAPTTDLLADYQLGTVSNGTVANAAGDFLPANIVGNVTANGDGLTFSGGWLEVANDPRLDLDGAFTLAGWIQPETNFGRIIDRIIPGGTIGYLLDLFGVLRVINGADVLTASALAFGQLVHVAATVDSATDLVLYINGQQAAEKASSPAASSSFGEIGAFYKALESAGEAQSYEGQHAALIIKYVQTIHDRESLEAAGKTFPLPASNQLAADALYSQTAVNLTTGLATTITGYAGSTDPHQQKILSIWQQIT